jgi:hypothetical protein
MKRYQSSYLGTLAAMVSLVVSCHPTRRNVSIIQKQPKLKVSVLEMTDVNNPSLEYHLTGCAEVDGQFDEKADSVIFTNRAFKNGLSGCVINVTSNESTENLHFKRSHGVLWMSGEFAIKLAADGTFAGEAKMDKTYDTEILPVDEMFKLNVAVALPENTDISKFTSYSGSLICSDPLGSLKQNAGLKIDQNLKGELSFVDLKIPADGDQVTCSEVSVTATQDNQEFQFFKKLENLNNSFIPLGGKLTILNLGKPYQLELRAPAVSNQSDVGVELSACTKYEKFDFDKNQCVPCPNGTEYREAANECVVPFAAN